MEGMAGADGILWNKDVVYTQQRPDGAEGAAKAGARFLESVFSVSGKGVVGVRHRGVVEISADYGLVWCFVYAVEYLANLFRTFDEGLFHLFMCVNNVSFQFVACDVFAGAELVDKGHE